MDSYKKKVSFFGIGAGKAGTTWLWSALRRHPEVYLPEKKELHYFNIESFEDPNLANPNYHESQDWYHSHFALARPDQQWGEISPSYIFSHNAAEDICKYNRYAKLFASIRNPTERTFSAYLYGKQRGRFGNISFEEALEKYPFLIAQSEYGRMLLPYFDYFPKTQIHLISFEDLKQQPIETLRSLQSFLDIAIDEAISSTSNTVNETGNPKHPTLNRMIMRSKMFLKRNDARLIQKAAKKLGANKIAERIRGQVTPFNGQKPQISRETQKKLDEHFARDLSILYRITGVDYERWLGNSAVSARPAACVSIEDTENEF